MWDITVSEGNADGNAQWEIQEPGDRGTCLIGRYCACGGRLNKRHPDRKESSFVSTVLPVLCSVEESKKKKKLALFQE